MNSSVFLVLICSSPFLDPQISYRSFGALTHRYSWTAEKSPPVFGQVSRCSQPSISPRRYPQLIALMAMRRSVWRVHTTRSASKITHRLFDPGFGLLKPPFEVADAFCNPFSQFG